MCICYAYSKKRTEFLQEKGVKYMEKRVKNPEVESFFVTAIKWQEEMKALREIVLTFPLEEALKWRQPCYVFKQKNVLIISCFKESCALNFFQGALLKDEEGILVKPGENTQSGRFLKFTSVEEIEKKKEIIKNYIQEALDTITLGKKIEYTKVEEMDIPPELQEKFKEDPEFRHAFEALTPGRQKGYILHFTGAKQAATRKARIEKAMARIFEGKGMHDR